jgi:hypothetical protein
MDASYLVNHFLPHLEHHLVDGIQVHKVKRVSQSKSGNVWIETTVCTGYTWSLLHWLHLEPTALATLGAHSPTVLHWLHLEPTHLLYYTGYTWSPLTYCTTLATLGAHSPRATE